MIARFLLCVTLVVALWGCSEPTGSESRRGGGLEIPNGIQATLVLRITDSSGQAQGNLPVQFIAGESWASRLDAGRNVVLAVDTTDSLGFVRVELPESKVFLLASSGMQGIHIPLQVRDTMGNSRSNPLPIPLRRLGKLNLVLPTGSRLALFGTPWVVESATEASVLDSLPQGEYMPVVLGEFGLRMGQTVDAIPFDTATDARSVVFSDPDNLMLTNFENRRMLRIWDPLHAGGYWWATARVDDSASWEHFGIHVLADLLDSAQGNNFLRVQVQFQKVGASVANVGLDFSTEPINTNLSHAEALRFFANGSGSWNVYVQTQNADGGNSLRWKFPIELSPQWKEYRIAMNQLICENDTALVWGEGTRLGTNLFWQTEGNGVLQLDDVVLEGFRIEDWVDP